MKAVDTLIPGTTGEKRGPGLHCALAGTEADVSSHSSIKITILARERHINGVVKESIPNASLLLKGA